MTIASVVLSPASCVSLETSLLEIAQLMVKESINHVPVCDAKGYAGMVDVGDILGTLAPAGLPDLKFAGDLPGFVLGHVRELSQRQAKEVMVRDIPSLPEDCPLPEALHLLSRHDRPLAVVDASRKVKGMLSSRAVLRHLMKLAGV